VRYLILSDIHSNWEALERVLEAASQDGYDQVVCCGDVVGYGGDPNAATDWTRANVKAIVRGNHDKACVGLDDLEWFNPAARASAIWTQAMLTPENLGYLKKLPRGPLPVRDFQILHGSPLDEDEYLVAASEVSMLTGYLDESPRTTNWIAEGVVKQHRTVGIYVNPLLAQGFALSHLEDWGPSEEQVRLRPEWACERARPPFLLVAAGR